MQRSSWQINLVAACAALAIVGVAAPARAAEPDRGAALERIERLEQRVNRMAQQQEQFMRRMGEQQERRSPAPEFAREKLRQQELRRDRPALGAPMPPLGQPGMAAAPAPAGPPPSAAKRHKDLGGLIALCLLIGLIFNILLAIWIFTDIRKRGEGSGIFIALALLAGIPAAIIYSLVRLGDKKT